MALASVIFDYVLWTFGFLRMSTTGLVAQALGRDVREQFVSLISESNRLSDELQVLATNVEEPSRREFAGDVDDLVGPGAGGGDPGCSMLGALHPVVDAHGRHVEQLRLHAGVAEDLVVQRDALLAEYTGGHVHIAHLSTARSMEFVRRAKRRRMCRMIIINRIDTPGVDLAGLVGSGPGGMTAAYHLAPRGYPVTVFESFEKPGGMLRYGIPQYRLPREALDAEIGKILDLGVELKCNTTVGEQIDLEDLRKEYRAIFVGIGAHKGRMMGIPGEEGPGVESGVERDAEQEGQHGDDQRKPA